MELYDATAESSGFDPQSIDHVLVCAGFVADSRAEAQEALLSHLKWWTDEAFDVGFSVEDLRRLPNYRFHYRFIQQSALRGEQTEETLRRLLDLNPVGTADQCVEKLEELIDASNARHVVLGMEGAGERAAIMEGIERFSSEVLTRFTP